MYLKEWHLDAPPALSADAASWLGGSLPLHTRVLLIGLPTTSADEGHHVMDKAAESLLDIERHVSSAQGTQSSSYLARNDRAVQDSDIELETRFTCGCGIGDDLEDKLHSLVSAFLKRFKLAIGA